MSNHDYVVTRGWDEDAADVPGEGSPDPLAEAQDLARELSIQDPSHSYQVVELMLGGGARRNVADWYRGTRQEG